MIKPPSIPYSEFNFSFARSSGPGGQNVNKVNSKAVLKWNLNESQSITDDQRTRLVSKLKLNEEGEVVVMSDRFRDQGRNKEDCIEKFYAILTQALHEPKKRKKTKKSYSSKLKAKESKMRHSKIKQMRTEKF
jgi:ribosome-associated protein